MSAESSESSSLAETISIMADKSIAERVMLKL